MITSNSKDQTFKRAYLLNETTAVAITNGPSHDTIKFFNTSNPKFISLKYLIPMAKRRVQLLVWNEKKQLLALSCQKTKANNITENQVLCCHIAGLVTRSTAPRERVAEIVDLQPKTLCSPSSAVCTIL